jgi:protein-tyrosine-phosphatase/CelD/BcsL family acetyltransferase involved in cellulose biosynthesis
MFEFKQDFASGNWILIEVNGRFWGSLPLAISAGIDFPHLLFELLVNGHNTTQLAYRVGIYSRSIGDDFWYYRHMLSECRRSPRLIWPLLLQTLREVGQICVGSARVDTFALDDLPPAVCDVLRLLRLPVDRVVNATVRRSRLYRTWQRRHADAILRVASRGATLHILFVCKGNICRSPFAEVMARRVLPSGVTCSSAGYHPLADRKSPPDAIESAHQFDVELSSHSSRVLSEQMLEAAQIVFVFDFENLLQLRDSHPGYASRIFLLGCYAEGAERSPEIEDPYSRSQTEYRRIYRRIAQAVDGIGRTAALSARAADAAPATNISYSVEPMLPLTKVEQLWSSFDDEPSNSFFTSWSWIGTWLKSLPSDCTPLLVRALRQQELLGLAVLIPRQSRRRMLISSRSLHLNTTGESTLDCVLIEHNGFAARTAAPATLCDGLAAWFDQRMPRMNELYYNGMTSALPDTPRTPPRLIRSCLRVPGFYVDLTKLAESDGDLSFMLSRNARHKLKRAVAVYAALGSLQIDEATNADEALSYFCDMKRLHIAWWMKRGKPHGFSNPFFETFHKALIEKQFSKGHIQLLRVSAGSAIIGYLYNFRYHGRVYAYQSGFADHGPKSRPGYVCHYLAIQHNFDARQRVYDFLAGTNRLKQSYSTDTYDLYWYRLYRPEFRFRAESALHAVKRQGSMLAAWFGRRRPS